MKPQDIIFIVVGIVLLLTGFKKPKVFVVLGLLLLLVSIPLFAFWVFFTAERLVYYAAFYMLIALIILMYQNRGEK